MSRDRDDEPGSRIAAMATSGGGEAEFRHHAAGLVLPLSVVREIAAPILAHYGDVTLADLKFDDGHPSREARWLLWRALAATGLYTYAEIARKTGGHTADMVRSVVAGQYANRLPAVPRPFTPRAIPRSTGPALGWIARGAPVTPAPDLRHAPVMVSHGRVLAVRQAWV